MRRSWTRRPASVRGHDRGNGPIGWPPIGLFSPYPVGPSPTPPDRTSACARAMSRPEIEHLFGPGLRRYHRIDARFPARRPPSSPPATSPRPSSACRGPRPGPEAPGPAGCHRHRQDLRDQPGHRAGQQADARARAQQDARRAAVQRVPRLLPGQRGRVLRELLRLLPARGVPAPQRHVHREGLLPQRRDRQAAPRGDAGAVRATRRDHRRQRHLHLRPRRAGRLRRDRRAAAHAAAATAATACCASSSTSSTSATTRR